MSNDRNYLNKRRTNPDGYNWTGEYCELSN